MTQAAADATTAGQLLPFISRPEVREEREAEKKDGEWEAGEAKAEKSCAIS